MPNLDYLRRQKISMVNRQFLTSYDWDFEIDFSNYKFYHPNMEILHLQTKSLDGPKRTLSYEGPKEVQIRGFKIHQPGQSNNFQDAKFTLHLADFEDQSIAYWFIDWANKCDSITTHTGYRRQDLMINCTVWQLNSNLEHVFQWQYFNCLPGSGGNYDDKFDDKKELVGDDVSLEIVGEFVLPTPLTQPLA